jgi:hypothetical protein
MRLGTNVTDGTRALRFSSFTNGGTNGTGHDINASSSSGAISLSTNSVERLRITSTGVLQLADTNSNGIQFPAAQIANANANTLDDYEEGTFPPTIVGTTVAGTGTYSTQAGTYTKVGRVVHFKCYVIWTAHTGTGNMRVGGLPFTSSAAANSFSAVTTYIDSGLSLTASNVLQGIVGVSSTQIVLNQYPVGGGNSTSVAMDTAAGIIVSGHYEV